MDLGLYRDAALDQMEDYAHVIEACTMDRPPPILPDVFRDELANKTFTNGSDRDFVAGKYATSFQEVSDDL